VAGSLDGKRIAVTGASGIAAAGARRFTAEGATVVILSIDERECRALATELDCRWEAVDMTDGHATDEAFARVGELNGLFAVAGGSGRPFGDGPLHAITDDGWKETFARNGLPAFHAARATVRRMIEDNRPGSVVIVSSVLATHPSPGFFATHAYAAAKAAALSLVTAAAGYYAPHRIRFNAIAPGLVDTPMAARAAADAEVMTYARAKQPLADGMLDPDDVAGAAAFLLSDDARMITGQTLAVDGGWSVSEA
jgi:NAD(P)-dependent dehydrogenase (short-subunit alcohol dehydrogenase family)